MQNKYGKNKSLNLSHIDKRGNAAMVNIGQKNETHRSARAVGFVSMQPNTLDLIKEGTAKKGDVLGVARLAGVMGAKITPQIIPLCHVIPLDHISVEFEIDDQRCGIEIHAIAQTTAKTGVEMEALTAVSVAALTLYDMCKSTDHGIWIKDIRLISKTGGTSGDLHL